MNVCKYLQSEEIIPLHCAKKHSCCLEPYTTQQNQVHHNVSLLYRYGTALVLVPHPKARLAHSWKN